MSKLRALFRSMMIHLLGIIFAMSPDVYAAVYQGPISSWLYAPGYHP